MLLLLAVVATGVLAYIVIYRRKRRQAQSQVEKLQWETEKAQRRIEDELRRAEEVLQKPEEQPMQLEEEVRCPPGEEEQRRQVEQETWRKAEEDTGQWVEAERRKAEAESKRLEDETQQKAEEEEHLKAKAESKRLEPDKRGGRPRTSTQDRERQDAQETKQRRPKPEIVCWKRERQWIVGVEVPEDLLGNSNLTVLQNAFPLIQDESNEGCWRLEKACGEVVVHWSEGEIVRQANITLGEDYLLFKLSGQNQNQGRRVECPSSGLYLVIVPDNWMRDVTLSGPPWVEPEAVSLAGYQAHFYNIEKVGDRKIAFRTPEREPVVIESRTSLFELVGTRLNDASEEMGPLFGERPPRIRAFDDRTWRETVTIVVGEEGSGRRRWRTQFSPVPDRMEQDLPLEIVDRKGGWYFLRIYDANYNLVESADFRFIVGLKEIKVHQPPPFPPETGHAPVPIELSHEPNCFVQSADGLEAVVQIQYNDDKTKTILTIPPDSAYDETHWYAGLQDGPKVKVTILVERLWWTEGQEDTAPSVWTDRPLALSSDDFAATSRKAVWLRFPRRRWIDEILMGFEEPGARRYPIKVMEKTIAIPLREFGDAQEVRDVGVTPLNLWIRDQAVTHTVTLCELVVRIGCKLCDFMSFAEEDMFCHIESVHINELFRPLTYQEMRDSFPSLPPAIYQCSYCDFYIKSDDPVNPTTTICRHIESCPKVDRSSGPVTVRFSVIDDVDEIREKVEGLSTLRRIYECNLCGDHLEEVTQSDMIQHLIENHRSALYGFR